MLATKDVLRTLLRGIMQCIRRLGLPKVTAAENGRILKVVRGAWAAVQPDPITAADLPQIPAEKLPETVPVPASVGQAGQVLTKLDDEAGSVGWADLPSATKVADYTEDLAISMTTLPLDLTNEILRRGAKLHLRFSAGSARKTSVTIYLPVASEGLNNSTYYPGYTITSYVGTPEVWANFQAHVDYPSGRTEGDPTTQGLVISINGGMDSSDDGKPTASPALKIEKLFVEF